MKTEKENIGSKKITFYEPEIYAIHYKGKPFSIGNLSYNEQKDLGIRYLKSPNVTRKVYFSKRAVKLAIHTLPAEIRDKVEIVRYLPENFVIKQQHYPLFIENDAIFRGVE